MVLSWRSASRRGTQDLDLGLSEDGRSCECWPVWRSQRGRSFRGSGFGSGSIFVLFLLAAFIFPSLAFGADPASESIFQPSADLSLDLVATADPAIAGELLTYVITVRNGGPNDATDVLVTDRLTLPAGVTMISVYATQGNYDPERGIWTVGSLAVGSAETLTIVLSVDSGVLSGTVIPNSAEVAGNEIDRDLGDNEASENVVVATDAQLVVTVICRDLRDGVIDRPLYVVEITIRGPSDAQEVWFRELLPPAEWLKSARYSYDDGASDEVWIGFIDVGDMAPGETKTILIYGDADLASPSAALGGTVMVSWKDTVDPACNSDVFSSPSDACFWFGRQHP